MAGKLVSFARTGSSTGMLIWNSALDMLGVSGFRIEYLRYGEICLAEQIRIPTGVGRLITRYGRWRLLKKDLGIVRTLCWQVKTLLRRTR